MLTKEQWISQLVRRTVLYAAHLLRGTSGDKGPEDVAQEAFRRIWENRPPELAWYDRRGLWAAFATAVARWRELGRILRLAQWTSEEAARVLDALALVVNGLVSNARRRKAAIAASERVEREPCHGEQEAVALLTALERRARASEGTVAARALAVIACMRRGILDIEAIATELGVPEAHVYPARALIRVWVREMEGSP